MLILWLAFLAGLFAMPEAFADVNPPTCANPAVGQAFELLDCHTNVVSGGIKTVALGETVFYRVTLISQADAVLQGRCGFEGGQILIITPDGQTNDVTGGTGSVPLICGDPTCTPPGLANYTSLLQPYVVQSEDIGRQTSPIAPCSGGGSKIQAFFVYRGGKAHCDDSDSCNATAALDLCASVIAPSNGITKEIACHFEGVACSKATGYASSAVGAKDATHTNAFCYKITITNSGTARLALDSVIDDLLGDITSQFPSVLPTNRAVTRFVGPISIDATTTNTVTVNAHENVTTCNLSALPASDLAIAELIRTRLTCDIRFQRDSDAPVTCPDCPNANTGFLIGDDVTVTVRVSAGATNGQEIGR